VFLSGVTKKCVLYSKTEFVSPLPPKSAPFLVQAALGGRRHRSSSHRRSTFHFPFLLSCFSAHQVYIPSSLSVYIILCSPHVCVCNCSLCLLCDMAGWVFPGIVLNLCYCIVVHYLCSIRFCLWLECCDAVASN
jgi:hypothetical protein